MGKTISQQDVVTSLAGGDLVVIETVGGLMKKITTTNFLKLLFADMDVAGFNLDNLQNLIHDHSTSGTDIDFDEDELQTINISSNTTFTSINEALGKSKLLRIITDGTLRTLAFPSWVFVGVKPADQQASKTGLLALTCYGTADTDVVAAYQVQI